MFRALNYIFIRKTGKSKRPRRKISLWNKKKRKRKEVEMTNHIQNERRDMTVGSGEILFFLIMRILYNITPTSLKPR